ncbi:MAG: hypothetical protein ACKO2G_04595 [Verrucomicrobiales bacterium]
MKFLFPLLGLVGCMKAAPELPPAEKAAAPEFPVVFTENFAKGLAEWTPRETCVWEMTAATNPNLELVTRGNPGPFRAPLSWLVRGGHQPAGSFTLTARGICHTPLTTPGRDLLLLVGWKGPLDYTYIHFSAENSTVHNVIMRVKPDGREQLPHLTQPVPKLVKKDWQTIRVWYDRPSGMLRCYVDDMESPMMSCKVGDLQAGAVGVGSFDDMVEFDDVVLKAEGAP